METLIIELAATAWGALINPIVLAIPLIAVVALVTGVAARVATAIEDLSSRTTTI